MSDVGSKKYQAGRNRLPLQRDRDNFDWLYENTRNPVLAALMWGIALGYVTENPALTVLDVIQLVREKMLPPVAITRIGQIPPDEQLLTALTELLNALDEDDDVASGSGRCPAVPCFDEYDYEGENKREGWYVLDKNKHDAVKTATAQLRTVLESINGPD